MKHILVYINQEYKGVQRRDLSIHLLWNSFFMKLEDRSMVQTQMNLSVKHIDLQCSMVIDNVSSHAYIVEVLVKQTKNKEIT